MQVQSDFAPLFRAGLREDFGESLERWESIYTQYMKSMSTDKPEQRAAIITGLSRLVEINDGEAITLDKPRMSDVVQGIDREYGIGFAITKRTVEDDQYNKAFQAAKWLGNAVNQTFEYRGASVLDDAHTGSIYRGIDNQPLLHTAHTLIGNSTVTVANKPATAVGLSMSGITQLMQLCQDMKDQNGDPIRMWPTKMILGNDAVNVNKAFQLLSSDKEPFTAENQDNALKKRLKIPEPIVNPYMVNKKWYFMVDDKYNDVNFVTRRKPTYEDHQDFATGAMMSKVTTRFLIWFVYWWGWVGTNPSV